MFEESNPIRNTPLINLYERLCALLSSLSADINQRGLNDGSGERLNGYIDELIQLTHDQSLRDFKVELRQINDKLVVKGEAYARQLNTITNYLYKTDPVISYFCASPPKLKTGERGSANSTTVNNHLKTDQQVSQSTNVQIEFNQTIINLTEALTNFQHEYPDESSKENKFATLLKNALPLAKDSLGIISEVLKIAGDVGIDPHTALKAIGL